MTTIINPTFCSAIVRRVVNCVGIFLFLMLRSNGIAQSSIAYFTNSPTEVDYSYSWTLNPDNWADFYISAGPIYGTFGPDSNTFTFSSTFGTYATPDTNEFLAGDYTAMQIAGSLISDSPTNGAGWTSPGQEMLLTTEYVVEYSTNTTVSWSGPIAAISDGYIGVRFLDVDGWHYGWIHICLPPPDGSLGVIVIDSAYNTDGDAPILAGAKPTVLPAMIIGGAPNGNLRLKWASESTISYQVQFKNSLDSRLWSNLDSTVTAAGTNCVVDLPTTGSSGFYRVVKAN
jgi:hypothetical protein